MYLFKQKLFFILILSYINSISSKFFIRSKADNSSFIYKKLEDIINRYFWSNRNSMIVTREVGQYFQHSDPNLKSMILINDNFSSVDDYQHYPKLVTFVMEANSVHQLNNTLVVSKSTIWWHVDSNYILVTSDDSCNNASTMLKIMWQYRLLSAIFLCYEDKKNSVMIYTYNPFTNRAPHPWTVAGNDNKWNKNWFLFKRPYLSDQNDCLNLAFDKLKFMDGYKLNCMIIPKPGSIWSPDVMYNLSSIFDKMPIRDAKLFETLFQVWNVTTSFHYNSTLYYLKKNHFQLILMPLFITTWESTLVIPCYPIKQISVVILTQKRPFLNPEDKIVSFYSRGVILLSIVSFGCAAIALFLNRRQRISSAVLEIMRLLVFCGIEQPLKELPIRIFFFGIFWLVTIINATFQGNLATFLTKPERISVETLADLKAYNYDVYMYPQHYNHFQESFLLVNKSLRLSLLLNGYEFVVNNSQAAYISSSSRGYGPAFKYQLHVSKPFLFDYVTISVIKNFPFVSRINEISLRCLESGLISLWDSQSEYDYRKNLTITEAIETAPRFRPISFADLLFAFKLLAIGLGCSSVMFIIERYFYQSNRKRKICISIAKMVEAT